MKKAFKFIGLLFGGLIIIMIIALIIDISNDDEQVKNTETASGTPKTEDTRTWKDKVKEVAASKGTETEKFDEVSAYANNYKPTKEEIADFENYIIKEYKDKKYIMDISNHQYMLENIFKSQVVEQYYDDKDQKPINSFAFDFLQNSKYNYRGVDTMTSESTLSNEKQMDKSLAEMGK